MEQKPLDRAPSSLEAAPEPSRSRTLAAPALRFDLRVAAEHLMQQDSYHKGSPTGRTLVKEPDLRIVLMALKSGARLEEHRTSGPISVQVLTGTVRLQLGADSVELKTGELLMLEGGVPHDVDAVEDAVFLLTIGRTTYQHVSDQHEPRS